MQVSEALVGRLMFSAHLDGHGFSVVVGHGIGPGGKLIDRPQAVGAFGAGGGDYPTDGIEDTNLKPLNPAEQWLSWITIDHPLRW